MEHVTPTTVPKPTGGSTVMGSYSGLRLGPLVVTESKDEFVSNHSELFQVTDLTVSPLFDDTGSEEHYERPLRLVLPRLELMGYTLHRARKDFECPDQYTFNDPIPLTFEQVMEVLRSVEVGKIEITYPDEPAVGAIVPLDIQQAIKSVRPPGRFDASNWDLLALLENLSPYSTLRVLAENPANLDLPVMWYFHEVVSGGWAKRDSITHGISEHTEYLLVTEGSSDAKILRRALDVLRPDISDFFRFVDMADGYPFSGTGNLLNFAKGLVSIRIQNKVIFIFDNDAEGVACMGRCNALSLPNNLKTMRLPDMDEFRNFPTLGPQGNHFDDINGRGASIECYLDLPETARVRWSSYNEVLGVYQGALVQKDQYKKGFLDLDGYVESYDYRRLRYVLDSIVAVCVSIAMPIENCQS